MGGRRRLILIGAIVIVGGLAVVLLLPSLTGQGGGAEETPTPSTTAVPTGMSEIVLSAQNISRDQEITEDAVILQNWPVDAVPVGALTSREEAIGMFAQAPIPRGIPVTESMLVDDLSKVPQEGSDIARRIPEGRVAIVMPVADLGEPGWAFQAGDRVDVLMSMLLVDLDEEFQSPLPNTASCVSTAEGEECTEGLMGRLEVLPTGTVVNVVPTEDQHPRLVTQLTVQGAVVLHVGGGQMQVSVTEEVTPTEETGEEGTSETETSQQTGTVDVPTLTLAVTPQDAAVLQFAALHNAQVMVVLRRSGDTTTFSTDPVTLQYLMDRYQIEPPPKLPYGITPPIRTLFPVE